MIFGLSISSVVLLALVGVCIYKFIWLPGFFSPLAKIPNAHPTAPYSPIWILWARYRERELTTIHEAHEKHGPIVRLGPTELSVNCVDQGIRTIYAGGFEKHDWYPNIFENYGWVRPILILFCGSHKVFRIITRTFRTRVSAN